MLTPLADRVCGSRPSASASASASASVLRRGVMVGVVLLFAGSILAYYPLSMSENCLTAVAKAKHRHWHATSSSKEGAKAAAEGGTLTLTQRQSVLFFSDVHVSGEYYDGWSTRLLLDAYLTRLITHVQATIQPTYWINLGDSLHEGFFPWTDETRFHRYRDRFSAIVTVPTVFHLPGNHDLGLAEWNSRRANEYFSKDFNAVEGEFNLTIDGQRWSFYAHNSMNRSEAVPDVLCPPARVLLAHIPLDSRRVCDQIEHVFAGHDHQFESTDRRQIITTTFNPIQTPGPSGVTLWYPTSNEVYACEFGSTYRHMWLATLWPLLVPLYLWLLVQQWYDRDEEEEPPRQQGMEEDDGGRACTVGALPWSVSMERCRQCCRRPRASYIVMVQPETSSSSSSSRCRTAVAVKNVGVLIGARLVLLFANELMLTILGPALLFLVLLEILTYRTPPKWNLWMVLLGMIAWIMVFVGSMGIVQQWLLTGRWEVLDY